MALRSADATLTSAKLAPRRNAPAAVAAVVVDTAAVAAVAADAAPVVVADAAATVAAVVVVVAAVAADATNPTQITKASDLSLAFSSSFHPRRECDLWRTSRLYQTFYYTDPNTGNAAQYPLYFGSVLSSNEFDFSGNFRRTTTNFKWRSDPNFVAANLRVAHTSPAVGLVWGCSVAGSICTIS